MRTGLLLLLPLIFLFLGKHFCFGEALIPYTFRTLYIYVLSFFQEFVSCDV